MGLLTGVFNEEILGGLTGFTGIGHTRYSTSGSSIVCNAQPFLEDTDIGPFAFGHNGNLTNADDLLAALPPGIELDATSDSEILAKTIAAGSGSLVERVKAAMAVAEGAYSVVMVTPDSIIAFRDPWGVRPLSIGTYPDGGYMIASESCAMATVGASYLREIEPGEVVIVDRNGMRSEHIPLEKPSSLCMFEYIYFARPDSILSGRSIYMARYEMGRALAKEHPIDADVVMAVPDSAIPGGIGYASESGLPYVEGLIKNRYIGRTFISPDQTLRAQGVQLKFNPIVENLRGQRVVVVDDSIVRGTTTPRIVKLLRDAGAKEVHLRITSPPIMHPCYLGVDMATYDELIAANLTVDQICERVGADSLGYLSVEHLVASTGRKRGDFCLGCLTGAYPSAPVMAAPDGDRQPALKN
jgi:amidophosphoribosyltransferase